jgi:hypothetical protein
MERSGLLDRVFYLRAGSTPSLARVKQNVLPIFEHTPHGTKHKVIISEINPI